MDFSCLVYEIWVYLKVLVQVLGLILVNADDPCNKEHQKTTSLALNSEWSHHWGTENWIVSVTCRIYLPLNYTPQDEQKGFFIKLNVDDHSVNIDDVYYPFDRHSVEVKQLTGRKEFLIQTMRNVWEYRGWKNYEIHIGFTNRKLTETGNWPRGTCSGPYSMDI